MLQLIQFRHLRWAFLKSAPFMTYPIAYGRTGKRDINFKKII